MRIGPVLANSSLRVLTLVGKFGSVILLAKLLQPSDFGEYALIFTLVAVLVYFVGFEFHTYTSRQLAESEAQDWSGLIGKAMVFKTGGFLILAPASALALVYGGVEPKYVCATMFVLLTELLAAELNWILVACGMQVRASVLLLVRSIGWLSIYLLAVVAFGAPATIDLLLRFWLVGGFCTVTLGVFLLPTRPQFPRVNSSYLIWVRRGMFQALPMLIAVLSIRMIFTIDRLVVESGFGKEMLAVYVFYAGIGNAVMSLVDSSVLVFFYSRVIKAIKDLDTGKAWTMFIQMSFQCAAAALILSLLAAFAVRPVVSWIGFDVYSDEYSLLYYFLGAAVLFCLAITPNHYLFALGRRDWIAAVNLLALAVLAAALYALPVTGGAEQVLIAVCAALGVNLALKLVGAASGLRALASR